MCSIGSQHPKSSNSPLAQGTAVTNRQPASLKLGAERQLKASLDIWKLVSRSVSLLLACLFGIRAGWRKCSSDHRRFGSKVVDLQRSMCHHYLQSKAFAKGFTLAAQKIKACLNVLSLSSFPRRNLTHSSVKGMQFQTSFSQKSHTPLPGLVPASPQFSPIP